jgi:hypothetical protein
MRADAGAQALYFGQQLIAAHCLKIVVHGDNSRGFTPAE